MAHGSNLISQIKLPNGTTYEVHDAQAIHSAADLGLTSAMVFKGVKQTVAELPATGNKAGDVWHVTATDSEYVWVNDTHKWEELGNVHDAAASDHTHTVTASGSASLAVSASGTVAVPTVTPTTKYLGLKSVGTAGTATVLTGLGTTSTNSFVTGVSTTSVSYATGASGTAKAITGLGTASTASITGISSVGSASNWTFTVANGLLTIGGGNGTAPTAASAQTFVTGLGTPSTATFVTGVSTTSKTLATGSSGTATAVTGLGTAATAKVLTSVPTWEPTLVDTKDDDNVGVVTTVSVGSKNVTANVSGTASGSVNVSGSTSVPVVGS